VQGADSGYPGSFATRQVLLSEAHCTRSVCCTAVGGLLLPQALSSYLPTWQPAVRCASVVCAVRPACRLSTVLTPAARMRTRELPCTHPQTASSWGRWCTVQCIQVEAPIGALGALNDNHWSNHHLKKSELLIATWGCGIWWPPVPMLSSALHWVVAWPCPSQVAGAWK
jgi:hypothetical protein